MPDPAAFDLVKQHAAEQKDKLEKKVVDHYNSKQENQSTSSSTNTPTTDTSTAQLQKSNSAPAATNGSSPGQSETGSQTTSKSDMAKKAGSAALGMMSGGPSLVSINVNTK